jgi:phosphohistidine swiveling domain-containing protein
VSKARLKAAVLSSDVPNARTAAVTVVHPTPAGGTSNVENMGSDCNPLPPVGASGNCFDFLWLGATDFNAESSGRKAATLHSLLLAGLPVASGFIVPPQLDVNGWGTELQAAVAALGGFPVAARSSSSLEDGEAASFAGQFTTCLFVTNIDELQTAIEKCRQSLRTATVSSYIRKRGLTERDAAPSVLVQRMVEARVAGVAFSIHPGTGREEHALVECCIGLADRLVSGQTTPTSYVLNLQSGAVVERQAGNENVLLGANVLRTLCEHLLVIQAHCGLPQDVEWALDPYGKIWILQSRPITRIHWHAERDEFTNANLREGVAARVCTPLMYSLYGTTLDRSLPRYLSAVKLLTRTAPARNWVRIFYGRPYWNATAVKSALCRLPGFDEQAFDQDLGIQREYEAGRPVRTPTNVRSMLAALPAIVALTKEFRQQLRRTEHYGHDFLPREAHYLQLVESSADMSDPDFFSLLAEVLGFHEKTYIDYFTFVYNHTIYQGDFKVFLDRIAAAIGEPISLLALTSGLRDISHMRLQRDFASLVAVAKEHGAQCAAWNEALTAFLRVHYFRADAELDISTPRWGERPESVTRMVEQALHTGIVPADPDASASDQFRQFEEELRRATAALRRSIWNRMRFGRGFPSRLRMARTYIRHREVLREYSTRVDHLVRRYALEAGRRLYQKGRISDPEDVFMLHKDELNPTDGLMADKTRAVVNFRRLMYQAYRLFTPPGELGAWQSGTAEYVDDPRGQLILKGTGCSAGRRSARARVITAISEFETLQPGEVLVTRSVDPSWTPLLGLVAGIIAETGGQLSHGAVITREYGLPGVLNVPDATRIIKTGQLVKIDGTKGTVTIVDEVPLSECAHLA